MRWGIQTESANNHSETATCTKEIELCKKYSVATNFVVCLFKISTQIFEVFIKPRFYLVIVMVLDQFQLKFMHHFLNY